MRVEPTQEASAVTLLLRPDESCELQILFYFWVSPHWLSLGIWGPSVYSTHWRKTPHCNTGVGKRFQNFLTPSWSKRVVSGHKAPTYSWVWTQIQNWSIINQQSHELEAKRQINQPQSTDTMLILTKSRWNWSGWSGAGSRTTYTFKIKQEIRQQNPTPWSQGSNFVRLPK